MSEEMLLRGFISAFLGLVLAWQVFARYDEEIGSEHTGVGDEPEQPKYLPMIPGSLLPTILLALMVLALFFYSLSETVQLMFSCCFGIFLHISFYYVLLVPLIPALRKWISARTCALLWLLPNYLYLIDRDGFRPSAPRWIIHAPGSAAKIIFWIWFIGCISILIWKTAEHMVFRRRVLRDAYVVSDPRILRRWETIIEEARIKKPRFKLMISPNVKTPLSVGLFRSAIRVVLPVRSYTPEELDMILRHEIIHISREDGWAKFFLVFCTAMCWFNPLMWVAMRKSAEDIERSCDETVLLGADTAERKAYGRLLLDTAGDERGFTTCLSASAKAMRYRLQGVMSTGRRRSGALIVGMIAFLLCMTNGYVALAYGSLSGAEVIYGEEGYEAYSLRSVSLDEDRFNTTYEIRDEDGVHQYLSGLELSEISGSYSFEDEGQKYHYIMVGPKGTIVVALQDRVLKVSRLYGEEPHSNTYYVAEGIDWAYLHEMIYSRPAARVELRREGDAYGTDFNILLNQMWKIEDGQSVQSFASDYPEEETYGHYSREPYDRAKLIFSKMPVSCAVTAEKPDGTVQELTVDEDFCFVLPFHEARYTVCAGFLEENGEMVEAVFSFDLGDTE